MRKIPLNHLSGISRKISVRKKVSAKSRKRLSARKSLIQTNITLNVLPIQTTIPNIPEEKNPSQLFSELTGASMRPSDVFGYSNESEEFKKAYDEEFFSKETKIENFGPAQSDRRPFEDLE